MNHVGQHHAADLEAAVERAGLGEGLHHIAAEAPIAPSSTVTSTSCSRARRSTRSVSSGLGEARVRHRGGEAESGELLGRLQDSARRVP